MENRDRRTAYDGRAARGDNRAGAQGSYARRPVNQQGRRPQERGRETYGEHRISAMKEYRIWSVRYLQLLFSNVKNLLVMLSFPAIAAIITIWVAGENMFVNYEGTKSACFVIVSAAIWGGLFNSIQTIVQDRENVKRDYSSGLRWRCYTASRATVQFLICALQSVILSLSIQGVKMAYDNVLPESGVIFTGPRLEYYLTILLIMYAADCMGLMICCIVKKAETASVMAPYILIVQLIFSGILFEMKGIANTVSYLMIARWGMEGMGSTSNLNELPLKIQATVPQITHEAEEMFESSTGHLLLVWLVLIVFSVLFVTLGNLFLHRVAKDTR